MPGRFLMADRTGVAFVATGTAPIPVGDTVDVVGFPGGGDYGLTLSDAEVRKAAGPTNAGKAVRRLFRRSSFSTVLRTGRWCVLKRSEEHTSELQSLRHLVCRLLLEKKHQTLNAYHRAGAPGGPSRAVRVGFSL